MVGIGRLRRDRPGRSLRRHVRSPAADSTRGADQEATIEISLDDAFKGAKKRITLSGDRTYDVTIPAGVTDGQRIRLAGQGGQGNTGQAGDLYLAVRIAPHCAIGSKAATSTSTSW